MRDSDGVKQSCSKECAVIRSIVSECQGIIGRIIREFTRNDSDLSMELQ